MGKTLGEIKKSITHDELANLPLKHFEGDVCTICDPERVESAVSYLRNFPVLGFDTETRPSFKKGCVNSVALLQLSTAEKAFLFRLNIIGLPLDVIEILESPHIKKVGVAIHDDIKDLKGVKPFHPGGFIELQEFVKKCGIENSALKKLAGIVLGFRISKSQRLSNWEAPSLTPLQKRYAATDAWVSLEVYNKLSYLMS